MNQQSGFSIVAATFILVVLALLGSYMVRLSGVQFDTSIYALQGAQAYQAARAGIEWAIANISNGGNCTQINAQTAMTFTGINGFTVTLSCASQTFSEGSSNPVIYSVTALGQFGAYNSANYIAREITISIVH